MSRGEEYRCFVGGLSWDTDDEALGNNFSRFGRVLEAKVMTRSGRSRGFGFVTFADQRGMEDAIQRLHNKELDGRVVTVNKAKPKDSFDEPNERERDKFAAPPPPPRDDACFKCGRLGHWARECSRLDRFSGPRYDPPPPPPPDFYDRYERYGDEELLSSRRERGSGRYESYRDHRGGPVRYHQSLRDRPGPYDRGAFDRAYDRGGYDRGAYDRPRVRRASSYERY